MGEASDASQRVSHPASHRLYQIGLGLSVAYCIIAGVLGRWTPIENGVDLAVCYAAGGTALRGASPYNYTELTKTHNSSTPSLAAKPSYTFAYPPSTIPACVLMSMPPWGVTQALWKLLNIGFLIGSVLISFRLFSDLGFTLRDKYLTWSYAFLFSPDVTVILVGQSSLFVLFTTLLTVLLCRLNRRWPAGVSLSLALTKPQLTFPIVCLLLYQRQFKVLAIAAVAFSGLGILGLYVGHSTPATFLHGFLTHSSGMDPTNPRLVGIQNLVTGVLGFSASAGDRLSVIVGLVSLGAIFAFHYRHPVARAEDVLPLLLLVGVLAFRAHSYDMVFLIPAFIWAVGRSKRDSRFIPIVILCLILLLPLRALEFGYQKVLSGLISPSVFRAVLVPFRSWILLAIVILAMYLVYRRSPTPGLAVSSDAGVQ